MARRRRPFAIADGPVPLFGSLLLLAMLPCSARGQIATVRVEENFRMEPNGMVLARLAPGTILQVQGSRGGWLEVVLEGWVWIRSLQVTDRGGFDLVVSAEEGENLRAEPRGVILAELDAGTLLEEVERIPGWIRARRSGWIWTESVAVEAGDPAPDPPTPRETVRSPRPEPALVTAPSAGLPVLTAPGGDTLGWADGGADVQVTAREGGWARIRLEGWAWLPPGTTGGAGSEAPEAPTDLTPEDVRGAPESFVGRVVTWELQYVSLERAERIRTDFFEGEPFLLTRLPGGEGSFVYVAVPPDRMELVDGLTPLERVWVTGRIRSGSSALTGSPILDLLELERSR
jgi:hypothetical protein